MFPNQEGIKNLSSKWYSGYFEITKYKQLHYIFVESLGNPKSDPIIVLFNGGPGAPSSAFTFSHVSPYTVEDGDNYKFSEYNLTWARNASLIFLDNPVGVGFSYAQRDVDQIHNDISNKKDTLSFMLQFYSFWP